MTAREPDPALPDCPECRSNERAERMDHPPKHDPHAVYYCGRCNRAYTGSPLEAHRMAVKLIDRETARGVMERVRDDGIAAGVIHGDEEAS